MFSNFIILNLVPICKGIIVLLGTCARRVLVKVVLFQLRRRSQPQNDATANFFANSERPILGLSNEVSFVPEILWKDG